MSKWESENPLPRSQKKNGVRFLCRSVQALMKLKPYSGVGWMPHQALQLTAGSCDFMHVFEVVAGFGLVLRRLSATPPPQLNLGLLTNFRK